MEKLQEDCERTQFERTVDLYFIFLPLNYKENNHNIFICSDLMGRGGVKKESRARIFGVSIVQKCQNS